MWIGKEIYFNSDRDGHFNLYAYDTASGKTAQVTHNTLWDVRWPSTDRQQRIVYELDGELQVLDVKTRQEHADRGQRARRRHQPPAQLRLARRT